MEITQLISLLKQGEGETLEFKASPAHLAPDVCAFLNTEGGKIIIGVNDSGELVGLKDNSKQYISDMISAINPVPTIKIDTEEIENKKLIIVYVDKSDNLHSVGGRIYIRLGANNRPLSSQEIIEKAAESVKLFFDELPATEASLKDIETEKVQAYLKAREETRGVSVRGSLDANMRQLKIIVKHQDKVVPTNGGILFFAKNPEQYIHYSSVRLMSFKDDAMQEYTDSKEFSGTLDKIIDDVHDYWTRVFAKIGGWHKRFRREEFFEYPLSALREALINALIHRNYFDPSQIRIFIFPNRLEIKNPGSFPPGVTPEYPIHKARNPILSQYLYDLGYIEKYGSGIIKIKEACKAHPLVNVYFTLRPFITEVVFIKEKGLPLDNTNQKILEYLGEGAKRSSEVAQFIGLSKQSALTRLQNLIDAGLIAVVGKGPERRYELFQRT